jgi:hypothetical protein
MMTPYSLEALIETRLTGRLDDSLLILRAASIQGMPKQYNYSIYIIPDEIEIDEQRRNQVALSETVFVVTVVRHAGSQITGTDSRLEAGPILVKVIRALLGWTPDGACEPLRMTNAPRPEFDAGFGFYPLAFKTRYIITGDSS